MYNKSHAISELKRLKKHIGKTGEKGLKTRITFFCIAIGSGLKDALVNYDLFDQHSLSERDLDCCFEMHDGSKVVHGIINETKQNSNLERIIKQAYGEELFKGWLVTFNDIENSEIAGEQLSFI